MATHKPFRELVPAGTNFEFMGRAKIWITFSALCVIACIAMVFVNKSWRGDYLNWSTDFKGGTEIIFGFHKAGTDQPVKLDPGRIRSALSEGGFDGFEVSDFSWEEETSRGTVEASGILVRTIDFGAVPEEQQAKIAEDYAAKFKAIEPLKISWSGDRMSVRSMKPVDWKASRAFFAGHGLELKPWAQEDAERFSHPEEGTGEYETSLMVSGIDAQYMAAIKKALPDVDVKVQNVYGVGAKAGAKLRNDGITAMFYASILVMLYLVVRFDIRYAPGAVVAMIHDAIITIGAFAFTWMEFSLTTVAAVLTIIGYSCNDTVVVFDRIRENAVKLKDKKFARIMNISINETLSRSLLTSVFVFMTTLMMNIFGTGLVRNFAFAMNVGVIAGAYSTVFIASPVALWVHNRWYRGEGAASARTSAGPARKAKAEEAAEADDSDGEDEDEK
jgi:preprotein translocase subunit SecF